MRTNKKTITGNFCVIKKATNSKKVLLDINPLVEYLRQFVGDGPAGATNEIMSLLTNLPEIPSNISRKKKLILGEERVIFLQLFNGFLNGLDSGKCFQEEQKIKTDLNNVKTEYFEECKRLDVFFQRVPFCMDNVSVEEQGYVYKELHKIVEGVANQFYDITNNLFWRSDMKKIS